MTNLAYVETLRTGTLDGLRDYLRDAGIKPGDRLPPERSLSETLGVSRSELRKALALMEANGFLDRQVGRGTFLTGPQQALDGDLTSISLIAERTSPHEAMMARLALEPQLAGQAAIHASGRQIAKAEALAAEMRAATDWETYENLDATFHETIAHAAGNSLLAELHRIVNRVRIKVVWARLDVPEGGPPADYHSFAEHEAIVAALRRRDRAGAQEAMRAHLRSISATLLTDDE